MKKEKKMKKSKGFIALTVALVVCLVVLVISLWQLAGIFREYKKGTDEYEELLQYVKEELPEDTYGEVEIPVPEEADEGTAEAEASERLQRISFEELKAINEEIVGWIEIPGTSISYPLMHTGDDVYYLNHTFSKKENSAGSIFIETLNNPDFTDLHTLIYGHNMKNGSMFAGLKNYTSPSYLVAHPLVYIDLEDGTHAYQIFSCYETPADSDSYTIGFVADEQYESFLQTLKGRSAYDTGVEVSMNDSIVSLSTCTRRGENRFLVHAKKVY